jgi:hypothetical protein
LGGRLRQIAGCDGISTRRWLRFCSGRMGAGLCSGSGVLCAGEPLTAAAQRRRPPDCQHFLFGPICKPCSISPPAVGLRSAGHRLGPSFDRFPAPELRASRCNQRAQEGSKEERRRRSEQLARPVAALGPSLAPVARPWASLKACLGVPGSPPAAPGGPGCPGRLPWR